MELMKKKFNRYWFETEGITNRDEFSSDDSRTLVVRLMCIERMEDESGKTVLSKEKATS